MDTHRWVMLSPPIIMKPTSLSHQQLEPRPPQHACLSSASTWEGHPPMCLALMESLSMSLRPLWLVSAFKPLRLALFGTVQRVQSFSVKYPPSLLLSLTHISPPPNPKRSLSPSFVSFFLPSFLPSFLPYFLPFFLPSFLPSVSLTLSLYFFLSLYIYFVSDVRVFNKQSLQRLIIS